MRKYWLFLIVLLIPLSGVAKKNEIIALHIYSQELGCRLIFRISPTLYYHYFQLSHPDRLVFDFPNVHAVKLFDQSLLKDTPIKRIRDAVRKKNEFRIVFDLKRSVKIKTFVLKPQYLGEDAQWIIDFNFSIKAVSSFKNAHSQKTPPSPIQFSSLPNRSRDVIVVIDPGHGGRDPGGIGLGGAHEKDIVLKISRYLQQDINRQLGFKAYLTRKGDYYLTLRQRLDIARQYRADMFIAIHADAYKNSDAHGATVFALSQRGATSEAARWLAKYENESELMGGVDLSDKNNLLKSILINLSQTATIHASLLIGQEIIYALYQVGGLHHGHVEQAAFVVLKSPDIPSLLVETGFISNFHEEHKLLNQVYQQRIASALMQGIRAYFVHSPPRGTWLAEWQIQSMGSSRALQVFARRAV
ncbi:N-acetylmuramoyl-L-alanine amidase [Coxiella-like endosymbiont of Rhipicephalus sanguineus]|uniref:N-acetylmuramoyl-L-alanine amidase n=1 Tax=Coxiella-like endosymbiont of Rhipicephalus sanguineus TaxID=1955402 RepID=UPI00203A543C|nr:N-acetylmuramoyl-L-alanine amidase [Coxiella-like endosymbiont of Rhipicephalus sanguineus]MBT8506770.1 N-acetylmuramoyl-L-alanine amidase [Coxiella-like endosymbiont of Rhipicephalus sanguineus]